MRELMIGKENIVNYFIESHKEGSNISRVCVSRDKVGSQSDHEDYVWEEIIDFGLMRVITDAYMGYDDVKYEDITMALVEYEENEGEDSWIECLITPNGTENIKVFG